MEILKFEVAINPEEGRTIPEAVVQEFERKFDAYMEDLILTSERHGFEVGGGWAVFDREESDGKKRLDKYYAYAPPGNR